MDHVGRSEAAADIHVFTAASMGDRFGGVPGRRGRQVEVEQLVEPISDLPVG